MGDLVTKRIHQRDIKIKSIIVLQRNVKAPNSTATASYHSDFPTDPIFGSEMEIGQKCEDEKDRCMVTVAIQMIGVRAVSTAPLRDF